MAIVAGLLIPAAAARADKTPTLPPPVDNGITATLSTGGPHAEYKLVPPGGEGDIEIVLSNTTDGPVRGVLRYGVRRRADDEPKLAERVPVRIAAGKTASRRLSTAAVGGELGQRYLDWEFASSGGPGGSGILPFAIMEPVGITPGVQRPDLTEKDDGMLFGLCGGAGFWFKDGRNEKIFRAAGLIGAESYRSGLNWYILERERGKTRWDDLDRFIAEAARNGMFVQPLVSFTAEWALSARSRERIAKDGREGWTKYPPDPDLWREFCRDIASRYPTDRLDYYEMWNEADIGFWRGSAEEYAELLIAGYEGVKAGNPDALVTTSGFATTRHRDSTGEVLEATLTTARDHFDVFAYHAHGGFSSFRDIVDTDIVPLLSRHAVDKRPRIFNETGQGLPFEREHELAATVMKKMAFAWSRGATAYYWYNVACSHPHYVMLNEDWSPRPSFAAYNEFARRLRGRRYIRELDVGPGRWGFLFGGAGTFSGAEDDYCVVAWVEDPLGGDTPVLFEAEGLVGAEAIDVFGNATSLRTDGPLAAVTLGQEPRYICLRGCRHEPRLRVPTLTLPVEALAVATGGKTTSPVTVRNPLDRTAEVVVTATGPAGVTVAVSGSPVTLAAGASAEVVLSAEGPIEGAGEVSVEAESSNSDLAASGSVRLAPAIVVPANAGIDRAPDFELVNASQVVNDADIDPALAASIWRGRDDCSAVGWINIDNETLSFTVDVRDDEYFTNNDLDESDAVVVSFSVIGDDGEPRFHQVWLFGVIKDGKFDSRVAVRKAPHDLAKRRPWTIPTPELSSLPRGGRYAVTIPIEEFGLTRAMFDREVRATIAVRDSDGGRFESTLRLSEAIGEGLDPSRFPIVRFVEQ
ncbi:MAG: hypothetical protein AAF532_00640 [Planctomycetota bacterium]